MRNLFEPILQHQSIIKKKLISIIQKENLIKLKSLHKNRIGVHIRLGDFTNEENEEGLREGNWNLKIPIKWYINIINKIQQISKLPIYRAYKIPTTIKTWNKDFRYFAITTCFIKCF